jgi:RHS repeat-associated protein
MRSLSARLRTPRFALWVAALLIAAPLPALAQSGEIVEYYALDAVGSVRVVFDANGNILGRMDYAPFGGELFGGTNLPDQRFAGLFRDGEAGLDYAQARSYQVRTGRFNVPDPVYAGMFDPQRWNRYSYAFNGPTGYTDRSGGTSCWSKPHGTLVPSLAPQLTVPSGNASMTWQRVARALGAPEQEPPEFCREYVLMWAFVPSTIATVLAAVSRTFNALFWITLVIAVLSMLASRRRHYLLGVLALFVLIRLAFGLLFVR